MRTHRSERFLDWVRSRGRCQRCGRPGEDPAHPRRTRSWGGGTGLKPSDYGALYLCRRCHRHEHDYPNGWDEINGLPKRDVLAVGNLVRYVDEHWPGILLWAEILEFDQERVAGLETE